MASIPLIPGLLSSQRQWIGRTNFHKGHVLERMANGRFVDDPPPPKPEAEWPTISKTNQIQDPPSTKSTTYRHDTKTPAWITYDRQVLRFFGYFVDPIAHENHTEDRIRRLVLLFYLTDHSLSISEPRVANSGIPQGEFLKRSIVKAPNGVVFEPADFNVGGHIKLHGRTIYLVDCDQATRSFYEEAMGRAQGVACKYPDDRSSQLDELDALKHRLKQKTAAVAERPAERVRKFHEHSQQVLRFFVSWQDPHPLYPETRRYVLHYYLQDDTIEIVEPKSEREGRGHFAVLLSRRRLASEAHKGRFLTDRDLRCGEYVTVFARQLLLEDCDAFTRSYYLETHGVTQEPNDPTPHTKPKKRVKWKLFEADETPRAPGPTEPTSDHRFYQNDALEHKQLRFRARFHGLSSADTNAQREFVVTFYLEDDTLAVFEPRKTNSGVLGGRFLDRGRFRKCVASVDGDTLSRERNKERSAYRAHDFYVGAIIAFEFAPHQKLELVEADRQTLTYCESHPERFPFSDASAILQTVATTSSLSTASVRRAFRAVDTPRDGTLDVGNVRRILERLGMTKELNAQQLVTLCRRFEDLGLDESTKPRPFLYDDFCDALALESEGHSRTADVYTKLRNCTGLRRLLREVDTGRQWIVDVGELQETAMAYKVTLSQSELQTLSSSFRGNDRQPRNTVDYNALCDRVFDGTGGSPSPRREEQDNDASSDDAFDRFGADDVGDASAPPLVETSSRPLNSAFQRPASPRRPVPPPLPKPLPVSSTSGLNASRRDPDTSTWASPSDARAVAVLRRVFGDRKYQLRKALRDRDHDKSGLLGEEAFMDAVTAIEPRLSDDDTYILADVYFPTNNSHIDYAKVLEKAFRS